MKIIMTGATGFVGSWVCRSALLRGHQVLVFTTPESNKWRIPKHANIKIIECPRENFAKEIASTSHDALILSGWQGVSSESRLSQDQTHNVGKSLELVNSSISAGASKIVGLGSQAEYGPQSKIIIDDWPLNPVTPYAKAKVNLWNEMQSIGTSSHVSVSWVRIFSAFGPLMNAKGFIPEVIETKLKNQMFELKNPHASWAFLPSYDTATGVLSVLENGKSHNAYNLSGSVQFELKQIAEWILGKDSNLIGSPKNIDNNEHGDVVGSRTEKLEALGWMQKVKVIDELALTETWLLGNPIQDPFFNEGDCTPRARCLPFPSA